MEEFNTQMIHSINWMQKLDKSFVKPSISSIVAIRAFNFLALTSFFGVDFLPAAVVFLGSVFAMSSKLSSSFLQVFLLIGGFRLVRLLVFARVLFFDALGTFLCSPFLGFL